MIFIVFYSSFLFFLLKLLIMSQLLCILLFSLHAAAFDSILGVALGYPTLQDGVAVAMLRSLLRGLCTRSPDIGLY